MYVRAYKSKKISEVYKIYLVSVDEASMQHNPEMIS